MNKELQHLKKEVEKEGLNKTIKAISCLNKMQNRIILEQNIDVSKFNKQNAKKRI